MISENAFTEKDQKILEATPLRSEMASPSEWIVRVDAKPDDLITVCVWPSSRGDELIIACACPDNARDLPCPHALDVRNQIRANDEILVQLLKRNTRAATVGHDYGKGLGPFY